MHRQIASSLVVAATVACGSSALATDVVYQTEDPFGGFFGVIGFDVSTHQSVATRFTPKGNYTLARVRPWFMNNSDTHHGTVTLTLRDDLIVDGESFPGEKIFESWTFNISTLGWMPIEEDLPSVLNPLLEDGKNYWLMADSDEIGGNNPVWNWAQPDSGYMSICNTHPADPPGTCDWSPAHEGAVVALTVLGTPVDTPCAPADLNCDGSVGVPDLLILLSEWGPCDDCEDCAADLSGDCSVGVPDLLLLLASWG